MIDKLVKCLNNKKEEYHKAHNITNMINHCTMSGMADAILFISKMPDPPDRDMITYIDTIIELFNTRKALKLFPASRGMGIPIYAYSSGVKMC